MTIMMMMMVVMIMGDNDDYGDCSVFMSEHLEITCRPHFHVPCTCFLSAALCILSNTFLGYD